MTKTMSLVPQNAGHVGLRVCWPHAFLVGLRKLWCSPWFHAVRTMLGWRVDCERRVACRWVTMLCLQLVRPQHRCAILCVTHTEIEVLVLPCDPK